MKSSDHPLGEKTQGKFAADAGKKLQQKSVTLTRVNMSHDGKEKLFFSIREPSED